MGKRSEATRYYLNPRLGRVAIIRAGVRFPRGNWLVVADEQMPPATVEALVLEMFPSLKAVGFDAFLTDFDVEEFERDLPDVGV